MTCCARTYRRVATDGTRSGGCPRGKLAHDAVFSDCDPNAGADGAAGGTSFFVCIRHGAILARHFRRPVTDLEVHSPRGLHMHTEVPGT